GLRATASGAGAEDRPAEVPRRDRRLHGRDSEAGEEGPAPPVGDLQRPVPLAGDAAVPPSPAALLPGLRPAALHRLLRARRRPLLRGGSLHRRRLGPPRWPAGDGPRAPEGPEHQGEHGPELRDAPPRGLPEGAPADGARGPLRPSGAHL